MIGEDRRGSEVIGGWIGVIGGYRSDRRVSEGIGVIGADRSRSEWIGADRKGSEVTGVIGADRRGSEVIGADRRGSEVIGGDRR